MQSFNKVLNESKAQVLSAKRSKIETEKAMLLESVKIDYMIEGKFSELPAKKKEQMKNILLECWSPKTGLKPAGMKYLNEGKVTLSPKSSVSDINLYIEKFVKSHLKDFVAGIADGSAKQLTKQLKKDVESLTKKKIVSQDLTSAIMKLVQPKLESMFK